MPAAFVPIRLPWILAPLPIARWIASPLRRDHVALARPGSSDEQVGRERREDARLVAEAGDARRRRADEVSLDDVVGVVVSAMPVALPLMRLPAPLPPIVFPLAPAWTTTPVPFGAATVPVTSVPM